MSVLTLNPKRRQSKIVDAIQHRGRVSVEELAHQFDASRETIRRDLTLLAESGRIQKIHGGAKLPHIRAEGPFRQRMAENAHAKRAIARRALGLVAAGQTIFVDTGSTTLIWVQALSALTNLTVITNSAEIAQTMSGYRQGHRVFLLGGEFDADNQETTGVLTLAQLRNFRAQTAIVSAGGIDARAGITDFNIEEAQVARVMAEQSDSVIVLADGSKFQRVGSFHVCPLEQLDCIVSDVLPSEEMAAAIDAAKVQLLCAATEQSNE